MTTSIFESMVDAVDVPTDTPARECLMMLSMEKLRIEQILFQIIHQMSLFVVGWDKKRNVEEGTRLVENDGKIDSLEFSRESIKSGKSLADLFQWKMRMDFDWFFPILCSILLLVPSAAVEHFTFLLSLSIVIRTLGQHLIME